MNSFFSCNSTYCWHIFFMLIGHSYIYCVSELNVDITKFSSFDTIAGAGSRRTGKKLSLHGFHSARYILVLQRESRM